MLVGCNDDCLPNEMGRSLLLQLCQVGAELQYVLEEWQCVIIFLTQQLLLPDSSTAT